MKKYFNEGDILDAILLHRVQPYKTLVKDTLASGFKPKGKIMMAGRLPKEVRDWFHDNQPKECPKFSLITIGDDRL